MKKGTNYQEKRNARWEVLCGKEECTKDVGGEQNENEVCRI